MNLKQNHYSRRALALLLTLVMCVGMIPTAFAAQQNSYHDPAEHWMQASGRTNELDANSVVTRETFKCGECGKATSFEVFRVPEYTRNGQPALSCNVKYSDGTMVDGVGKGDTMDGIPGKDATYTGYHYTKAACETCGGINTNMSKSEYFIPKAAKKTLYCDRIIKDNKNCKNLAPGLKHKLQAQNKKVVEEFDRAKQKMYKRYERALDPDKKVTEKDLSYAEYYEWLDQATQARDAYLAGRLSEEDALNAIRKS